MGRDKAPKIDELISKIPKDQIEILREIWEHFLKNKEWPKGRPFRKDRLSIVEKLIADLDPIFIWHYNKDDPAKEYYRLTTEGVYAVEGFEGVSIKLILYYLDYLRKKFDEKPDFEEVTAQELKEKCHINSEEARILGELLDMGNSRLWGSHASGLGTSEWKAGVIEDIEDLYNKDPQEFLIKHWDNRIEWIITHKSNKAPRILGLIGFRRFVLPQKIPRSKRMGEKTVSRGKISKTSIGIILSIIAIVLGVTLWASPPPYYFETSAPEPTSALYTPLTTPPITLTPSPIVAPTPSYVTVAMQEGVTETLFNGDLSISLIAISFEGDPLRHKVIATVGSPGYPNLEIERKDVGYVTTYNGSGTFEIRITRITTFSAEFMVTRIE